MKINSGKHLLGLKEQYQDLMAPRSLGNMGNDEVVTICITGNQQADYTEISRAIYELRRYVNSLNGDRAKILYEDDPKQKENFNFHITYKFSIDVDSDSIYSEKIKDLIQEIYTLRSKDTSVKYALKNDPDISSDVPANSEEKEEAPAKKQTEKTPKKQVNKQASSKSEVSKKIQQNPRKKKQVKKNDL